MKKIILLFAVLFSVTACNLDLSPENSIATGNALHSVSDAAKFRYNLYTNIRTNLASGAPIYLTELMADSFHASITFGNRNGEYYKWELRSTFSNLESLWGDSYYVVTLANFLIDGIDKLEEGDLSADDRATLELYRGECAFAKAYAMYSLVDKFCPVYDAASASSEMGLILLDEQFTTPSDPSTYKGRSSLADTYKYIEDNLAVAEPLLSGVATKAGSQYFNVDVVCALKARMALLKGEWETAARIASSLADSGKYPLVDNSDDFIKVFVNDSGAECIMQFWSEYPTSLASSYEYDYIKENSNGTFSPNYIPEQWIVELFDEEDLRFQNWFTFKTLTYGTITGDVYMFTKFPGNPELMDGTGASSTYQHKIKPFRIAEQYLIAAEAYAKAGNEVKANEYLNKLKGKRIPGVKIVSYTGDNLLKQIKDERARELFGEGFRLSDLRRWGDGLKRSRAQDDQIINNAGGTNTEFLEKSASDKFWVWPIPQAEIDANPQIRNQQNPGY